MKVRWVGCLIVLVLAAGCETGPRVNDVSFFELITDYMAGPPPDASNVMGLDDRKAYGEDRWVAIGLMQNIVAVVVYVEWIEEDRVRFISARPALRHERTRYQEEVRN